MSSSRLVTSKLANTFGKRAGRVRSLVDERHPGVHDLEGEIGEGHRSALDVVDAIRGEWYWSVRQRLVDRHDLEPTLAHTLVDREERLGVVHPESAVRVDLIGIELHADCIGRLGELFVEVVEGAFDAERRIEPRVHERATGMFDAQLLRLGAAARPS